MMTIIIDQQKLALGHRALTVHLEPSSNANFC